jgi:DNA-binding transcriptional LysR family regulator
MKNLDLNLLHIIVTLQEEGSVSKAAERLGLSQPAVSGALAKLRESLDDQLFIRSGGAMRPTAKTLAMLMPIQNVLTLVQENILVNSTFAPESVTSTITVALSDVGEIVFLPRLMQALREQAPHATLRSVNLPHNLLADALESGTVDLAIGYFPDLARANIFQQRILSHHFVCLLRADHPLVTRHKLTLSQFVQLEHAVVHAPGRSQEIFKQYLKKEKIQRKVFMSTPNFLSIPSLIVRSDLVVTVPHAMGIAFGKAEYGLKAVDLPFPSPRINLRQHWHRKYNKAPRTVWLRQMVSELFNDERDEWK